MSHLRSPVAVAESVDKVTAVLAAATEGPGGTKTGSADEEAEIGPDVAVRKEAGSLDSWTVIQVELVKAVIGFAREQPVVRHRPTVQTAGKDLGNRKAESVGVPVPVGTPVPAGACAAAAADRAALLVCVGQMLEGAVALGKEPDLQAVLAEAGNRGFVENEDLGQVGHNRVSDSGSHSLLAPADRKIPSAHKACFPCLLGYDLAPQLDIFGVLEGHTPGQGNQALAEDLWEPLVVIAVHTDFPHHMAVLSFLS